MQITVYNSLCRHSSWCRRTFFTPPFLLRIYTHVWHWRGFWSITCRVFMVRVWGMLCAELNLLACMQCVSGCLRRAFSALPVSAPIRSWAEEQRCKQSTNRRDSPWSENDTLAIKRPNTERLPSVTTAHIPVVCSLERDCRWPNSESYMAQRCLLLSACQQR